MRMVSRLALRQVCHDIRQPMAGVLALAGALLADEGLPESTRTRLRQIAELAEWQSDVIEHWLLVGGGGAPDVACQCCPCGRTKQPPRKG